MSINNNHHCSIVPARPLYINIPWSLLPIYSHTIVYNWYLINGKSMIRTFRHYCMLKINILYNFKNIINYIKCVRIAQSGTNGFHVAYACILGRFVMLPCINSINYLLLIMRWHSSIFINYLVTIWYLPNAHGLHISSVIVSLGLTGGTMETFQWWLQGAWPFHQNIFVCYFLNSIKCNTSYYAKFCVDFKNVSGTSWWPLTFFTN